MKIKYCFIRDFIDGQALYLYKHIFSQFELSELLHGSIKSDTESSCVCCCCICVAAFFIIWLWTKLVRSRNYRQKRGKLFDHSNSQRTKIQTDRWTNGKPRFKYVCPGYRKKECNFKAVDGVLLDEFVVLQLSACWMKTASISKVFWRLKSRRSWNSRRLYKNITSLKRNVTNWKWIFQRRQ